MAFDKDGNKVLQNVGPNYFYPLGSNALGGAHEDELSALLYDWFVDYVRGIGFDLGEDGRSGAFYTGIADLYSEALTEYIARYDELRTGAMPVTAEDYLASLKNGAQWFTYDERSQKAVVTSLDAMMYNFINRGKMAPSLDSYNYRSNENDAFVDSAGTRLHFSATVRDMLKALIDGNGAEYTWTDDELAYITSLYNDYKNDIKPEHQEILEIMSPINYIINTDGGWKSTAAPYWRFRVGSNDGDHGFPAAWLTANGLWKHCPGVQVDIGISWNMGHGAAELKNQDLYNYIDGIMRNAIGDGSNGGYTGGGGGSATPPAQTKPEEEKPATGQQAPAQPGNTGAANFTDTAGHWAADAIRTVVAAGLFKGVSAANFDPDGTMTRAMFATVLARHADGTAAGGASFGDVPAGRWYTDAVLWAAENGIVSGVGGGLFDPDGQITREQLAVMLHGYAKFAGIDTSGAAGISGFADDASVSPWASDALAWAVSEGLISGKPGGLLDPKGKATRAEVAAILERFIEKTL
ncbi:MAG: S-layer homology domain-containing protein [Clostridiales Family XIII bacterium]|jgi:hypothetical protein|nr:S-layer homology domain-containing protein [Clostridiales Family XIII bacterium]